MQLLAKFKKILYMGFRATLNVRKFKVAPLALMVITGSQYSDFIFNNYIQFCNFFD